MLAFWLGVLIRSLGGLFGFGKKKTDTRNPSSAMTAVSSASLTPSVSESLKSSGSLRKKPNPQRMVAKLNEKVPPLCPSLRAGPRQGSHVDPRERRWPGAHVVVPRPQARGCSDSRVSHESRPWRQHSHAIISFNSHLKLYDKKNSQTII